MLTLGCVTAPGLRAAARQGSVGHCHRLCGRGTGSVCRWLVQENLQTEVELVNFSSPDCFCFSHWERAASICKSHGNVQVINSALLTLLLSGWLALQTADSLLLQRRGIAGAGAKIPRVTSKAAKHLPCAAQSLFLPIREAQTLSLPVPSKARSHL